MATLTPGYSSLALTIPNPVDPDDLSLRDDVYGIKVWYSTVSGFTPPGAGTLGYDGPGLSCELCGLTPGTTYYVRYAIVSTLDRSVADPKAVELSGTPSATTIAGIANYVNDVVPQNAPTGVTATKTSTADGNIRVTVGWSYTQGTPAADFLIVYYGTSPVTTASSNVQVAPGATSVPLVVLPNTTYYYGVAAARRTDTGLKISAIATPTPTSLASGTNTYTGEIQSTLSAGWLVAGTTNDGIVLDGASKALTVRSGGASSKTRVRLGYGVGSSTPGAGTSYGMQVMSADGNSVVWDTTDAVGIRGSAANNNFNLGDETTNPDVLTTVAGSWNIALGAGALNRGALSAASRSYCVGIGRDALRYARGGYNIGIGDQAVKGNATLFTGANNVGIGKGVLSLLTTGSENISVGSSALGTLTSGQSNIAIGRWALEDMDTGSRNIAIGTAAMWHCLGAFGGSDNIAIGNSALNSTDVVGGGNIAIGSNVLESKAVGGNSVFIGNAATTTAMFGTSDSVVIGAMSKACGGAGGEYSYNSVVLGSQSSGGVGSTVVGAMSGGTGAGWDNTLVGYSAGSSLTSGNGNTFIGSLADVGSNVSDNVVISTSAGIALRFNGSNWYAKGGLTLGSTSARGDSLVTAAGAASGTTQHGVLVNTTTINASSGFMAFRATGVPDPNNAESYVHAFSSGYNIRAGAAIPVLYTSRSKNIVTYELNPGYTNTGFSNGSWFSASGSANGVDTTSGIQKSIHRSAVSTLTANVTTSTANATVTFSSAVTLSSGSVIRTAAGVVLGKLASAVSNATTGTFSANSAASVTNSASCLSISPSAFTTTVSRTAASTAISFGASVTLPAGTVILDSSGLLIGVVASNIESATTGTLTSTSGTSASSESNCLYFGWSIQRYAVGPDIARAADAGCSITSASNTWNINSGGTAPNYFEGDLYVNASTHLIGTLRVFGSTYLSGSIISLDGNEIALYPGSATGSDSAYSVLSGAGDASTTSFTRGGRVITYGLNHATYPGYVHLIPSDGQHVVSRGSLHISDQAISDAVSDSVGLYVRNRSTSTSISQYDAYIRGMCSDSVDGAGSRHYSFMVGSHGAAGAAAYSTELVQGVTINNYTLGTNQTLTEMRGLVINSLSAGTTNWAIYQGGSANSNYFAGRLVIGTTTDDGSTKVQVAGAIVTTQGIKSTGTVSGIGYNAGAGGAVAQATSRTTGVTLNNICGKVTLFSTTTTAGTFASFTLTNSAIFATDVVIANFAASTSADKYNVTVTAVSAGSCRIQIHNIAAVAVAEAPVINFAVIKAVQS